MSKTSSEIQEIVSLLEQIIDTRFKYLRELELENRRYALDIKVKDYDPLVKKLLDILEV
jgi:hypothetical protein